MNKVKKENEIAKILLKESSPTKNEISKDM